MNLIVALIAGQNKRTGRLAGFLLVGEVGLGHLWRPRRHILENKFSRVVSLANCHWQFSPTTFCCDSELTIRHHIKKLALGQSFYMVGEVGLEPTTV